jgi:histidine phosphotransferase ChpT
MIFNLSAADLAALLCSKVCHDIISPVGAINNGLELLDEGGADEDAMNLIKHQRAHMPRRRLQFARIAFGAAGSAGDADRHGRRSKRSPPPIHARAKRPDLDLGSAPACALMPKNKVKLLLNLILTLRMPPSHAAAKLAVKLEEPEYRLAGFHDHRVSGPMLRVPPKFLELHSEGQKPAEPIDAHSSATLLHVAARASECRKWRFQSAPALKTWCSRSPKHLNGQHFLSILWIFGGCGDCCVFTRNDRAFTFPARGNSRIACIFRRNISIFIDRLLRKFTGLL